MLPDRKRGLGLLVLNEKNLINLKGLHPTGDREWKATVPQHKLSDKHNNNSNLWYKRQKCGEKAWKIWSRAAWRTMRGFMRSFDSRIIAHAIRCMSLGLLSKLHLGMKWFTQWLELLLQSFLVMEHIYSVFPRWIKNPTEEVERCINARDVSVNISQMQVS